MDVAFSCSLLKYQLQFTSTFPTVNIAIETPRNVLCGKLLHCLSLPFYSDQLSKTFMILPIHVIQSCIQYSQNNPRNLAGGRSVPSPLFILSSLSSLVLLPIVYNLYLQLPLPTGSSLQVRVTFYSFDVISMVFYLVLCTRCLINSCLLAKMSVECPLLNPIK